MMMTTLTIFEKHGVTEDSLGSLALFNLSSELILTLRRKVTDDFWESLVSGELSQRLEKSEA